MLGCVNINDTYGRSIDQWCWPDGQPYLEQDSIVVDVFGIVKDELKRMAKKDG